MCTATRRTQSLVALAAALALLLTATAACASTWSRPHEFRVGSGHDPAPRAAIAADGTSAVVWRSKSGGIMLSTGRAGGRFSPPRAIAAGGAGDHAVAARAGGGFLAAWQQRDGLWVALRTRAGRAIAVRRVTTGNGAAINGVQVAADPLGGWVVAERRFVDDELRLFRVHGLTLAADGGPIGESQDLGLGFFGIDGRQVLGLAVDRGGRAVLAFGGDGRLGPYAQRVFMSTRPHGSPFSAPVALGGGPAVHPRVAAGPPGRALIATTRLRRGYAHGYPTLTPVGPAGELGAPFGPAVLRPSRTFRPSVAFLDGTASVLVFQVGVSESTAPVRAVAIDADGSIGELQVLTTRSASEPVVLPLIKGHALAMWLGRARVGAALAGPDGDFSRTPAPFGPPPSPFHTSATNRHLATGGGFAVFAWARELEGIVRVSVRRFVG